MPAPQNAIDPLPLPQLDVEAKPAKPIAEVQALPPGAGWVNKQGAGAYFLGNILNGWMAGKDKAERMKLDRARQDISGAKTVYDVADQNYRQLIDQGLDPNKPEDKAKLDAAKVAVTNSWNNYLERAGKYAIPTDQKTG